MNDKNLKNGKTNPTSRVSHLISNKGITLIALVITIIVMLILVAVTINMAINGGLFNYASKAAGDTKNAIEEEDNLGNDGVTVGTSYYNSIDNYINNIPGEKFSKIYVSTEEYVDANGDIAVIPKGFAVGTSEGINTVREGLVIQDEEGNQFVWIPVTITGTTDAEKIASFEAIRKDGYGNGSLQNHISKKTITEPYSGGYDEEASEYNEMRASVINNGGFYIGRYEAGTTSPRSYTKANGTSQMYVKRDLYPYNNVGWGLTMNDYTSDVIDSNNNNYYQGKGAVALSKAMYDEKDVDVVSTLCYGVQWDAMLKFMGKDNETDSTNWGNYLNHEFTITRGNYAEWNDDNNTYVWNTNELPEKGYQKSNGADVLLTTGASDENQAKNIYDVAGNCVEWTMEGYSSGRRVYRGGNCFNGGSGYPASHRYGFIPYLSHDVYSFRPALYIKN